MSETIPEAPIALTCTNCGCSRQVRTTALVQDPDPAAKTRYTYLRTACLKSMCRKQTVGWEPTCTCSPAAPVPCTVLDPFHGSGTTTLVARELSRNSIGIELNPESIQEARERLGIAAQAVLDTGAVEYDFLVVE